MWYISRTVSSDDISFQSNAVPPVSRPEISLSCGWILLRQCGGERRCRLTEVILVGRDGTSENDSDQENLALKKKEVRLGSGGEEGGVTLELGLSLPCLSSPNPTSHISVFSLTSPILYKEMKETNKYKPQVQKLKRQENILEGFQISEGMWSKDFPNKCIVLFFEFELLTVVIISRINCLNYRVSVTGK